MSAIPMTAAEVREVQLATLKAFCEWCGARGLSYQLAFGSLLGSVRHSGYIPWDDDIDIAMPRCDFNRLCRDFPSSAPADLRMASLAATPGWPLPFAKVWDARTIASEHSHLPLDAGVGIDVFPIDDLPSSRWRRTLQLRANAIIRACEVLAGTRPRAGRRRAKAALLAIVGPILRLVGSARLARWRDRIASRSPKHGALAGILAGPYDWTVSRDSILTGATLQFEGRELPGPSDPHAVLTAIYGDFRTPPPTVDQRSHHAIQRFWKTRIPAQEGGPTVGLPPGEMNTTGD